LGGFAVMGAILSDRAAVLPLENGRRTPEDDAPPA